MRILDETVFPPCREGSDKAMICCQTGSDRALHVTVNSQVRSHVLRIKKALYATYDIQMSWLTTRKSTLRDARVTARAVLLEGFFVCFFWL